MDEFVEVGVFTAGKRCGVQYCPWMGDWFTSWSPRNSNSNAEGQWAHWVNLAAFILSHKATEAVCPSLYRPDLVFDPNLYTGGNTLTEEQIKEFFLAGK